MKSHLKHWRPWQATERTPWNLRRVAHLHRRAGFAASWSELQRDLHDGAEVAVERLLAGPSQTGPTEFDQLSSTIHDAAIESGNINRLKAWWLHRMVMTPAPLVERLTLVWHNHFATSSAKVSNVRLMGNQNAAFRELAMAQFGRLLRRVAKDPALLQWLDADANRKEHPNENLAREIMELFTLGEGNYSEEDVKAAARALTGWSVNKGEFRSYTKYHDAEDKTIFGETGAWNGDDLLRMLVDHTATSRRIAFRICEMLMGEGITTDDQITELAEGLRERELDVPWAIGTALRSEAFFSEQNIGSRVTSPAEFIVGAVRSLEMTNPPPSTLVLAEVTATLGQDLFNPPNVFGWPGGRSWLTSRSMIARANFAAALVSGRLRSPAQPFDAVALAGSYGFTNSRDIASFYSQLLLGQTNVPDHLQRITENSNRLVATLLASPAAQLG